MRRATLRLLLAVGLASVLTQGGCYSSGAGQDPNDNAFYFPVGLAVSPSGNTLFVVNSDFDLRFNAGTLQALDMKAIRAAVDDCIAKPTGDGCYDYSTRSTRVLGNTVLASVRIGAFAADVTAVRLYADKRQVDPLPETKGRVLIPVRGDASLTYVDFTEGDRSITLDCGGGAAKSGSSCTPPFHVGPDANANNRGLTLEGEPFSVSVAKWAPVVPAPADDNGNPPSGDPRASGGLAAVVHQSTGDVSVIVHAQLAGAPGTPRLAFTLNGLPPGGTSIAALDIVEGVSATRPFTPRFIVTNRAQASVSIVSFVRDKAIDDRGFLVLSDVVPINTNSAGWDSRGVVVDPPSEGETRPIRVFLSNRQPASLIIGNIDPVTKRLHFYENVPLPIGPARLTRAVINGVDGKPHTRVFVASFDARSLVSYDPDARKVGNVLDVGRGPYALAVAPSKAATEKNLGFVANFSDSNIQVIDLDPTSPLFEQVVLTLGPDGA